MMEKALLWGADPVGLLYMPVSILIISQDPY